MELVGSPLVSQQRTQQNEYACPWSIRHHFCPIFIHSIDYQPFKTERKTIGIEINRPRRGKDSRSKWLGWKSGTPSRGNNLKRNNFSQLCDKHSPYITSWCGREFHPGPRGARGCWQWLLHLSHTACSRKRSFHWFTYSYFFQLFSIKWFSRDVYYIRFNPLKAINSAHLSTEVVIGAVPKAKAKGAVNGAGKAERAFDVFQRRRMEAHIMWTKAVREIKVRSVVIRVL